MAFELVPQLASSHAGDLKAGASSTRWLDLVTLYLVLVTVTLGRDRLTFFFCARQAAQARDDGTPGIILQRSV